jgi:hypothetical protein
MKGPTPPAPGAAPEDVPAMSADQVRLARQLASRRAADGRREYTSTQVAKILGVSPRHRAACRVADCPVTGTQQIRVAQCHGPRRYGRHGRDASPA